MIRKIGALLAGILVLGAVVATLQQLAAMIQPLPEGLNPMDPDQADEFRAHLEAMPASAWAIGFLSELLGALAGAVTAGVIARDSARGLGSVVVGLAMVGSALNWTSFYHPMWFIVGQLIGYPLVLMAAWSLVTQKRPPAEAEGRPE